MNRRRFRNVIVHDLQVRFVLAHLSFIFFVGFGLVAALFGPLALSLLAPGGRPNEDQVRAATIFLALHDRIWLAGIFILVLSTLEVAAFSHRVSGPLVRFRRVFRAAADGDVSMRVRVRSTDYLQPEAAALDTMITRLRRKLLAAKGRAARLQAGLDDLRAVLPRSAVTATRALESVERQSQLLQRRLDVFRTATPSPGALQGNTDTHVLVNDEGTPENRGQYASAPEVPCDEGERGSSPARVTHPASSAQTRRRGFTLIEVMIVVALFGTLAAIAIPAYGEALNSARVVSAIAGVRSIGLDITRWNLLNGRLPDSLAEADILDAVDPWGTPYEYLRIAGGKAGKGAVRKDRKLNPINADFDLYSIGRDRATKIQVTNKDSLDDIIRANDGGFVGLGRDF